MFPSASAAMPSGKPGPGLGRVANRSTLLSRSSRLSCAVAGETEPPISTLVTSVSSRSVGSRRVNMVSTLCLAPGQVGSVTRYPLHDEHDFDKKDDRAEFLEGL